MTFLNSVISCFLSSGILFIYSSGVLAVDCINQTTKLILLVGICNSDALTPKFKLVNRFKIYFLTCDEITTLVEHLPLHKLIQSVQICVCGSSYDIRTKPITHVRFIVMNYTHINFAHIITSTM